MICERALAIAPQGLQVTDRFPKEEDTERGRPQTAATKAAEVKRLYKKEWNKSQIAGELKMRALRMRCRFKVAGEKLLR
jgi:hypothetical protein